MDCGCISPLYHLGSLPISKKKENSLQISKKERKSLQISKMKEKSLPISKKEEQKSCQSQPHPILKKTVYVAILASPHLFPHDVNHHPVSLNLDESNCRPSG